MRQKHNKKRNTAFIFEVLIRELTKSIVEENSKKKKVIISLIRENFHSNTFLAQDLDLYKGILETVNVDRHIAEKLIFESRLQHCVLDGTRLFMEQTQLINKINKVLSKDVFSNFIPNYRDIATIYQIFNSETKTKQRILKESQLIKRMIRSPSPDNNLKALDNLTLTTFVHKFNEKYNNELISEQKKLLTKFISSFADDGAELKVFLNEEIERLKIFLSEDTHLADIRQDENMLDKTKDVLKLLDECADRVIDTQMIQDILKIQKLVKEINT